MNAAVRSTVVLSAVLALCAAACSSSPNNPPAHDGGQDVPVEAAAPEAGDAADAPVDAADAPVGAPDAAPDEMTDAPVEGVLFDAGPNCPSSFTARPAGTTCFKVVTACDYPEGRCGCLLCEVDTMGFGYAWSCRRWDTGGTGCPARSPPPGSPCADPGRVCRYSTHCSVAVGDDLECREGTWQAAVPIPACGFKKCSL